MYVFTYFIYLFRPSALFKVKGGMWGAPLWSTSYSWPLPAPSEKVSPFYPHLTPPPSHHFCLLVTLVFFFLVEELAFRVGVWVSERVRLGRERGLAAL